MKVIFNDKHLLLKPINQLDGSPIYMNYTNIKTGKTSILLVYQAVTLGKIYDVLAISHLESDTARIRILCDDGKERWVYKRYFTPLDEHRDNLIEEICK